MDRAHGGVLALTISPPPPTPTPAQELAGVGAADALAARGPPRQGLLVVASLIDRVPNLGGLARTCEIFRRARGL